MEDKSRLTRSDLYAIRVAAWRVAVMLQDARLGRDAPVRIRVEDNRGEAFDDFTEEFSDAHLHGWQVRKHEADLDFQELVDLLSSLGQGKLGKGTLCLPYPVEIVKGCGRGKRSKKLGSTGYLSTFLDALRGVGSDQARQIETISQDLRDLIQELQNALRLNEPDFFSLLARFHIKFAGDVDTIVSSVASVLSFLAPRGLEAADALILFVEGHYTQCVPYTLDLIQAQVLSRFDASAQAAQPPMALGRGAISVEAPADTASYESSLDREFQLELDECRRLLLALEAPAVFKRTPALLVRIDEVRTHGSMRHRHRARMILGAAALQERNYAEALRWYESAIPLQPDDPRGLCNAALASALRGDEDQCRAYLSRAEAIDPHSSTLSAARARIAIYAPSIVDPRSVDISSVDDHTARADLLWETGRREEAIAIVEGCPPDNDEHTGCRTLRDSFLRASLVERAMAARSNGEEPGGELVAGLHEVRKRIEARIGALAPRVARSVLIQWHVELVEIMEGMGDWEAVEATSRIGIEILQGVWGNDAEAFHMRRLRARILTNRSKVWEVLDAAGQFAAQWSQTFAIVFARIAMVGLCTVAVDHLRNWLALHDSSEVAAYAKAMGSGAPDPIRLADLLGSEDVSSEAPLVIMSFLVGNQRPSIALEVAQNMSESVMCKPGLRLEIAEFQARILMENKRYSEIDHLLAPLVDGSPGNSDLPILLVEARLHMGDYAGAKSILERIAQFASGRELQRILHYLVQVYARLREWSDANDAFDRYLATGGRRGDIAVARPVAHARQEMGDLAGALDLLTHIDGATDNRDISFWIAALRMDSGDLDGGADGLLAALDRWHRAEDWRAAFGILTEIGRRHDLQAASNLSKVAPPCFVKLSGDDKHYALGTAPSLGSSTLEPPLLDALAGKGPGDQINLIVPGYPDKRSFVVESVLSPPGFLLERVGNEVNHLAKQGHGVWSVQVQDGNLTEFLEMLKYLEEPREMLRALYLERGLPLSFLGGPGSSVFRTLDDLLFRQLPIWVVLDSAEWPGLVSASRGALTVPCVLDTSAIWALYRLGEGTSLLTKVLDALPGALVVQGALDEIDELDGPWEPDGVIGLIDGKPIFHEYSAEERELHATRMADLRTTIQGRCRGWSSNLDEGDTRQHAAKSTVEAYSLSKHLSAIVVSEDGNYHRLFDSKSRRTSAIALLQTLCEDGLLPQDEFLKLYNRAIQLGFHFLPVNGSLLLNSFRLFFGKMTVAQIPTLRTLSARYGADLQSAVRVATELLIGLALDERILPNEEFIVRSTIRSIVQTVFSERHDSVLAAQIKRSVFSALDGPVLVPLYQRFFTTLSQELDQVCR